MYNKYLILIFINMIICRIDVPLSAPTSNANVNSGTCKRNTDYTACTNTASYKVANCSTLVIILLIKKVIDTPGMDFYACICGGYLN